MNKNPVHFKNDKFRIDTWFERDRAHVSLVNDVTDETVVEWWDEEVAQAVEDGFLDPRNFLKSALEYAEEHKLIWNENRPVKKNPLDNYFRVEPGMPIPEIIANWRAGRKGYDPGNFKNYGLRLPSGAYFHGWYSIKDLWPYREYTRAFDPDLMNSIIKDGFKDVIHFEVPLNGDPVVSEGNHRLRAAIESGGKIKELPVYFHFVQGKKMKKNPRYYGNAIPDPQVRKFLKYMRRNIAQLLKIDPDTIEISTSQDFQKNSFVYADILFTVYPNPQNLTWPEIKKSITAMLSEIIPGYGGHSQGVTLAQALSYNIAVSNSGNAMIMFTISPEDFDVLPNPRKNPVYLEDEIPHTGLRQFLKRVRRSLARILKIDPDAANIAADYEHGSSNNVIATCVFPFDRKRQPGWAAFKNGVVKALDKILPPSVEIHVSRMGMTEGRVDLVINKNDLDSLPTGYVNPRGKMKKLGRAGQQRVSKKIAKLRREGYSAEQAAAIAYKMERGHHLGPLGGKKNPIADKDLQECIRALAVLVHLPHYTEEFDEHILDALEAEGLWSYEKGVTKKGKAFLEAVCADDYEDL